MYRRNRSRFHAVLSSPLTLIAALVLLVLLGRAAVNIHAKAQESAEKLAEAQISLSKLENNQTSMQAKIDELSTDAGREASIREKYHAVSPGESVAVIVDDQPQNASAADAATSTEQLSWWQKVLRAIGL